MATKNVHQPALQDAIDHFCIDCDPYGIMVSAVNGTIEKVYVDESGNICIPACSIKAAMRFASSEIGKKMEAKKNRQTVRSVIFFDKEMYPIGKKKPDMIVEDVVTRGQGDKVTRVKTFRPLIKEWKIKCKIISYGATKDFIEQSLELAGIRYGLLSHRPEFGRFEISSFKESK